MPNGGGDGGAKGTPSSGNIQGALHLSGYLNGTGSRKKKKKRPLLKQWGSWNPKQTRVQIYERERDRLERSLAKAIGTKLILDAKLKKDWSDAAREAAAAVRRAGHAAVDFAGQHPYLTAAAGAALPFIGHGVGRAIASRVGRAASAAGHTIAKPSATMHSRAVRMSFEEGYTERMRGYGKEGNPHMKGSIAHHHWNRGWSKAGQEGWHAHLGS